MARNESAPPLARRGAETSSAADQSALRDSISAQPTLRARITLIRRAAKDKRLSRADLATLIIVLDSIGKSGCGFWGFGRIAIEISTTRRSVIRSISWLDELGYIRRRRTAGGGSRNSYEMPLHVPYTGEAGVTGGDDVTSDIAGPDRCHPCPRPVTFLPAHKEESGSKPRKEESTRARETDKTPEERRAGLFGWLDEQVQKELLTPEECQQQKDDWDAEHPRPREVVSP